MNWAAQILQGWVRFGERALIGTTSGPELSRQHTESFVGLCGSAQRSPSSLALFWKWPLTSATRCLWSCPKAYRWLLSAPRRPQTLGCPPLSVERNRHAAKAALKSSRVGREASGR